MYTLLSGLWRNWTLKEEFYVLILGLDNAGKTTFLESAKAKFTRDYKGVNPSKITTTVGLNIGKIDTQGIRLNFWDLGGQEELQVSLILEYINIVQRQINLEYNFSIFVYCVRVEFRNFFILGPLG